MWEKEKDRNKERKKKREREGGMVASVIYKYIRKVKVMLKSIVAKLV